MQTRELARAPLLLGLAVMYLAVLQLAGASENSYDPEQQDGIPIFSARSISNKPLDEWNSNEQSVAQPAQRRQADSDLDDGLEDEDEDEYKSGSSPHESIENPSYGESSKAARDGDEIEDFFDKHLGPPQEATTADESATSVARHEVPAVDPDTDDDPYETAASSPLSSIFHSLLSSHTGEHKHKHKRPFLQISTSSSDSDAAPDKTKDGEDSLGSSSLSSPMKTSQSAQSYVEASPITLSFAPVASPSQMVTHDLNGQEMEQTEPSGVGSAHGVREIYIGRRPTVMNYLQQTYTQQQQPPASGYYSTAGSSNVWRGASGRQMAYEQDQANDYSRSPIAASHAYQREQPGVSAAASDGGGTADDEEQTVTYGLSFGGAPTTDESAAGGGQDENAAGSVEAGNQQEQQQLQEQPQQQGYIPYNTRYSTSSTQARNNYYNNPSSGAASYYAARPGYSRAMPRQQTMVYQQRPSVYQPYARGSGSTRYHRDPSESMNSAAMAMQTGMKTPQQQQYYAGYQPVGTAQYRDVNQDSNQQQPANDEDAGETINRARAQQYAERQHLLATLDREIKASPHYRNNNAAAASSTAQTRMHANDQRPQAPGNSRQHMLAIKTLKKSYKGDDLDSYNSFHSEMDPYKTFTSTSRMINDPTSALMTKNNRHQVPIQSGSSRILATDPSYSSSGDNTGRNLANSSVYADHQSQQINTNLLTGRLSQPSQQQDDLLRNTKIMENNNGVNGQESRKSQGLVNSRVRREDSDEREIDNDQDDDGVWVDDDEDDDNRQQSSDVNETSQDPQAEGEEEEDTGQQDAEANNVPVAQHQMNPPGVIGGPHGYELSPNDLMIYHG